MEDSKQKELYMCRIVEKYFEIGWNMNEQIKIKQSLFMLQVCCHSTIIGTPAKRYLFLLTLSSPSWCERPVSRMKPKYLAFSRFLLRLGFTSGSSSNFPHLGCV